MPKRTPRVPGQPLAERPCDEPHIPEMLSRTLFRDGIHRQRGAPRKPRTSIFTEDHQKSTNHPASHSVSPEDAPRARGIVSPVSPLTPEIPSPPPISIAIVIAPATPSSELEPRAAHWYFHDVRNNHYEESRVSIGTQSECTTLGLCPEPEAPARCIGEWESGVGRWSVRRSVRGVRRWLRGRGERKAREKVEREREREGELVVRERVVVGWGRGGDGSLGLRDLEGEGESKGASGKARGLVTKGTKKLRKLQPGGDREGVPALSKKEVWKPMRRIKGFQHIE